MPDTNATLDLTRQPKELVSMGLHVIRVKTAEARTSKAGNATINFRCEILGERDPDKGKALFLNFTLLPQSRWVLDKFLDAIKAPMTGKMDIQTFVGCRLRVQVVHEERKMDDGSTKQQERVIEFLPLSDVKSFEGGQVAPPESEEEIKAGEERLEALVNPEALETEEGGNDPF